MALVLGLLYGGMNYLTMGLTLPGSSEAVAIRPQIILPLMGGFLMGPLYGFLIGVSGNFLGDLWCGYGTLFWPFSLGNGLMGAIPGLLYLKNIRRIETIGHFSSLLIAIVIGNIIGIGIGLITYNLIGSDSLQQLTWLFFQPIIVVNVITSFILVPPILYLFKRLSITFDIRISGSIYYLIIAMMLPLIYLLNLIDYHSIRQGLSGTISAEQIQRFLSMAALNNFRLGGSIGIAVVLLSLGIAFLLIQYLLRPIRVLIHAAQYLKDGQFDRIQLDSLTQKNDELGKLAQVFAEAVTQVRQREEHLKQIIHKLQVDINREQETKHVQEITETDYFRSLQKRSIDLRARKEKQAHEK